MPNYDAAQFDPPAPMAVVTLRIGATGANELNVPMLIDSGADVTLVPRSVAEKLGFSQSESSLYELVGFDGSRHLAPAIVLDLVFLQRIFRGRYLVIDSTCGILGRDVLNHVSIVLDGPRQLWTQVSP